MRVLLGTLAALAGSAALVSAYSPFCYGPGATPTWLGALSFLLPIGVAALGW